MQKNELTDRDFWTHYWTQAQIEPVSAHPFYEPWLKFFPKAPASFIEIGGFPGNHAAYFAKYLGYQSSLVDFLSVTQVVQEVEKINGLTPGTLHSMQADILNTVPDQKYDVVFSAGFIEHFTNTQLIFEKHCEYLKEGGTLFISLPNFNGVSGWIQKWFDPENYKAHSIASMDPSVYARLIAQQGLTQLFVGFAGTPHLWLDHPERASPISRLFIRIFSAFLQRTGTFFRGRYFAPYLIVVARK